MKTTHGQEIANRLTRIVDDAERIRQVVAWLEDENAGIRTGAAQTMAERDAEIVKLKFKVAALEAQKVDIDNACEMKLRAMRDELTEHKRLAQEKVDALEELLSKATLPEEPEATKAPAVEVMPGPDYVTREELWELFVSLGSVSSGEIAGALRTKRFAP